MNKNYSKHNTSENYHPIHICLLSKAAESAAARCESILPHHHDCSQAGLYGSSFFNADSKRKILSLASLLSKDNSLETPCRDLLRSAIVFLRLSISCSMLDPFKNPQNPPRRGANQYPPVFLPFLGFFLKFNVTTSDPFFKLHRMRPAQFLVASIACRWPAADGAAFLLAGMGSVGAREPWARGLLNAFACFLHGLS